MIVYAICLPLAIVLGYMITDPLDRTTDYTYGIVLFLLVLPLLLRWYHAWLITIWNMSITFILIPGLLPGWMPVSVIAFGVALGHYILNRQRNFLHAPSLTWSLIFLGMVVAITAYFRGGIGFHAFGNEAVGGKRYLWIWVAILGYFALISQRVPLEKRKLYATLFLIGSATQILTMAGTYLGPAFNFLYIFFPGGTAVSPFGDPFAEENLERFGGLAGACIAAAYVLLARYGIAGVLDFKKIWRPILFVSLVVLSAFGGYRSLILLTGLTLVLVFVFEGLLRSRLMPVVALAMILIGGIVITFSERLPLPVQRCLAIFPLKIDPVARISAEASTEWRLEIWKYLLPQVPQYLFLGKGLTFDVNDMAMYNTLGNQQAGGEVGGGFTLAGEYHNGPLSVIIPFGIWGVIGYLWFLVAALQALWRNYKHGDIEIKNINTLLLSCFIAKTILFLFIFGGFYSDLAVFLGIVGFSISVNGGIASPAPAIARPQVVFNRFRPLPVGGPVPSS